MGAAVGLTAAVSGDGAMDGPGGAAPRRSAFAFDCVDEGAETPFGLVVVGAAVPFGAVDGGEVALFGAVDGAAVVDGPEPV